MYCQVLLDLIFGATSCQCPFLTEEREHTQQQTQTHPHTHTGIYTYIYTYTYIHINTHCWFKASRTLRTWNCPSSFWERDVMPKNTVRPSRRLLHPHNSDERLHIETVRRLPRCTYLVIAAIFGTNHTQPNIRGLWPLLQYRFLSCSFSFLLLDTVFLRTTLRASKILPLFHYCFQCLSTHTWGKLLCENDPSHPWCCQKCEGFAVLGNLTATVLWPLPYSRWSVLQSLQNCTLASW